VKLKLGSISEKRKKKREERGRAISFEERSGL